MLNEQERALLSPEELQELEEAEAKAEEEATAKATVEAEAEAEFEASLEGLSDEEKDQKRTEGESEKEIPRLDYDTELEKERARLGKKIDKERDRRILAEKSKGLSREDAEKLVEERVALAEKRMFRGRAEQLAGQMAGSEAEKDLILLHYDNSIISSGNLEEDMDKAYALANIKRVQGTISELKKAAIHKRTLSSASDAGAPVEQKPKPKYSQDIIDGAKFAGKTPEEFAKSLAKK